MYIHLLCDISFIHAYNGNINLQFGEDYKNVSCVPRAKEWYQTNVLEKESMESCRDGQVGYEGFFEAYVSSKKGMC